MPTGVYKRTKYHRDIISKSQTGRVSVTKGRSWNEMYGLDRANKMRENLVKRTKTKESIAKQSASLKKTYEERDGLGHQSNCSCCYCKKDGSDNPFYGKKHNEESRLKISKSRKGKGLGFVHSEESKIKMSNNRKGKALGRVSWNKGIKYSDERRKKISLAIANSYKENLTKGFYNYLYILSCNDLIKIGITKNLQKRISSIQKEMSSECQLIKSITNNYTEVVNLEKYLHNSFSKYREIIPDPSGRRKFLTEWFTKDILIKLDDKLNQYIEKE